MSHAEDIKLSKILSYLLRHGAVQEGLNINSEGYVAVSEILAHKLLSGRFNIIDVQRVVKTNSKQRFKVIECNGNFLIKANQGHSLKEVDSHHLQIISKASEAPTVIHGTYLKNWSSIKKNGLNRMSRNHIHLVSGLPQDQSVVSGLRQSCEIYIYIDIEKALLDGIQFYKSENDVILTPGDSQGVLNKKYFKRVVEANTGKP